MLVHSLADGVEGAALSREEEVGAGVVGELEVELVACEPLPAEAKSGDHVLALAPSGLGALVGVDLGHHVIAQPGVHDEVAAAGLLDEADDGVRIGHARGVAEADAGPLVARLGLDDELDGVAGLQILPLGQVRAVALVKR